MILRAEQELQLLWQGSTHVLFFAKHVSPDIQRSKLWVARACRECHDWDGGEPVACSALLQVNLVRKKEEGLDWIVRLVTGELAS